MKKLYKTLYCKNLLFIFLFIFIVGCSSVGKRTVSDSAVLSRTEIIRKSIEKVKESYNEDIPSKNVGIYKKGYRDWKVVLYSEKNYYLLYMTEDGRTVSLEKKDYTR